MYWGEGGIYLWYMAKVVYTHGGIYHSKYDMYDAIKVAMRYVWSTMDCTSDWRDPLPCCT